MSWSNSAGRKHDELEALRSIYDGAGFELQISLSEVKVLIRCLCAVFSLPPDYPSVAPILDISVGGDSSWAEANILRSLIPDLEQLLEREEGNEVLFAAIELIRSKVTCDLEDPIVDRPPSTPVPPTYVAPSTTSLMIYHSEPVIEKKSVFISHFAVVTNLEEVQEFREFLLGDKKLARATHNIFCYRFSVPGTAIVHADADDDGEAAAGGRLAEVVRLMNLPVGVAVMVSRWFGGVLLGPSRFAIICNVARSLLETHLSQKR